MSDVQGPVAAVNLWRLARQVVGLGLCGLNISALLLHTQVRETLTLRVSGSKSLNAQPSVFQSS